VPASDLDFAGCWRDQRPGETLPETYSRHAIGRLLCGPQFEPGTWHIYSDVGTNMPALDITAMMIRNHLGNPPGFIYNRDYPVFMGLVAAAVDR
jgi:hypothetical protein